MGWRSAIRYWWWRSIWSTCCGNLVAKSWRFGKWIVVFGCERVGHLRWKLFFFAIVSCHLLFRDGSVYINCCMKAHAGRDVLYNFFICTHMQKQMDVLDIWPTGVTDCFSGFQWDGWSMESAKNCWGFANGFWRRLILRNICRTCMMWEQAGAR